MSENTQEEKGNSLIRYMKGSLTELRKVSWPSKQETWRKSWIVIWFSLGFAVFLGGLDFLLNKIIEVIV